MPIKAIISKYNDFRIWFFMYATRPIECINTAFLFSFGAISFINYWDLLTMPSYLRFNIITNWAWFLMVLAGIAQLTALRCKTLRSNQASGIIMIITSCVWLFIAAVFYANNVTFITATGTYFVWAVATLMTGHELLTINKQLEKKQAMSKN